MKTFLILIDPYNYNFNSNYMCMGYFSPRSLAKLFNEYTEQTVYANQAYTPAFILINNCKHLKFVINMKSICIIKFYYLSSTVFIMPINNRIRETSWEL